MKKDIAGIALFMIVISAFLSCKKSSSTILIPVIPPPVNIPIVPPTVYIGYSLLWNDEFNDAGIDPTKWNF